MCVGDNVLVCVGEWCVRESGVCVRERKTQRERGRARGKVFVWV